MGSIQRHSVAVSSMVDGVSEVMLLWWSLGWRVWCLCHWSADWQCSDVGLCRLTCRSAFTVGF